MGYSTTIFNGITLNINSMIITKRQKTVKQTVGNKVVVLGPALAVEAVENVLSIKGRIVDANKDTTKIDLENSQDGQRHGYSDGTTKSGDYAILTLTFNDIGGTAGISQYVYDMTLVEW